MPGSDGPARKRVVMGYAIAGWSLLFLLPHAYMALGGRSVLVLYRPSVALVPESQLRLINAVASVILGFAILLGLALARPAPGAMGRRILGGITWLGCSVATAHGLVGMATRILDIRAAIDGHRPPGPWLFWDLFLWEPWFLTEGILLGIAGWYLTAKRSKSLWIAVYATGICLAVVTALWHVRFY